MIHARPDYNRIQDPAGKIPADEPVFLLRAQDELACKAVAYYASLCEQAQPPEMAATARAHSDRMAAWSTKKVPDVPPVAETLLTAIQSGLAFADGDAEAGYIAQAKDLNCPTCGGSGHKDDAVSALDGIPVWLLERGQAQGQTPTRWYVSNAVASLTKCLGGSLATDQSWTEDAVYATHYVSAEIAQRQAEHEGVTNYVITEHLFRNNRKVEPDMRAICEKLGFDPTNHHNAAKCPYCRGQDTSRPMADTAPPATARERWFYEQGRLAEADSRTRNPEQVKAWLVELHDLDNGPLASLGDTVSLGYYHTGFTDINGQPKTTQNVWEARRYTQAQASEVVTKSHSSLRGFWCAVPYSIGLTATRLER